MKDMKGFARWIQIVNEMRETEIQKLEIVEWAWPQDKEGKDTEEKFTGRLKFTTKDGEMFIMKVELDVIGE